ncbi:hypothetical protein, partial [Candidatus Ruminimicrobium bovinum]|uniref:hypothetical protein n=1 Tax=Candidatus Ruminimicrobium bovinum TaxID=3242779 RepID=UPI0039B94C49
EKQIDDWLEDYSYDAFYYEEVSFLLKEIKRYKEEILKISVEQKHYISFGKLLDIGTDLEIVKNDNCWNRDNKYTEQIKLFFEMKNFTCGYTKYANKEGNSTIVAYETGANFVRVYFSSSYIYNTYTYTYKIAGKENIEKMKKLALEGKGLQSYIMKNVRDKYEIRTSTPI